MSVNARVCKEKDFYYLPRVFCDVFIVHVHIAMTVDIMATMWLLNVSKNQVFKYESDV